MKRFLLVFLAIPLWGFNGMAQHEKCASMQNWQHRIERDPDALMRMEEFEKKTSQWIKENPSIATKEILTIPVVVHVLYHTDVENISDAQIQSQIDVLNADFRLQNTDSLDDDHPFWQFTVDTQIEFCLAKQDPNGNASNGITRTYTDSTEFESGIENEKFDETGGKDGWDATKYLNLWVCNLTGTTLGYAAFPSDLEPWPAYDGVTIRHQAFGTTGTAGSDDFTENNLGRTATHEVGHWLNLRHIWGDEECGDDMVEDTPSQEGENYGCPTFPHRADNACGTDENGEMFMNYMDYVDDHCMNMFSYYQGLRMWAAINGARAGLKTSQGCTSVTSSYETEKQELLEVMLYPNPSNGELNIDLNMINLSGVDIIILNTMGQIIYQKKTKSVKNTLDLTGLSNGIYFIQVNSDLFTVNKKFLLNQ